LIRTLAECGDIAAAELAYRKLQELLHRELNAEPSAESKRLIAEIRSRAGAPPPAIDLRQRNRQLPIPATQLVGRQRELAAINRHLCELRMVTVNGPGGTGKTRLALEVGAQRLGQHKDGVWFVDLSSLKDASLVVPTIAQAQGLTRRGNRLWRDALVELLLESDRLVILDNCEQVLDACAAICADLLATCDGVRILATSRVPLGIPGEQRLPLSPMDLPGEDADQAVLLASSAIRMFEARARNALPEFEITEKNVRHVAEICRRVDALPLGIEMAAAKVAALSLERIAEMLDRGFESLSEPRRPEPRHRSLVAVIDWSCRLLPEGTRELLAMLSVFAGGWTLEAAEAVTGPKALEGLTVLSESSLIQYRDGRYWMLETLRRYAADELNRSQIAHVTKTRHLEYVIWLLRDIVELERSSQKASIAPSFGPELDNIRQALEWSVASAQPQKALLLAPGAAIVLDRLDLGDEGTGWLRRIIDLPGVDPTHPARVQALQTASWLCAQGYTSPAWDSGLKAALQASLELVRVSELVGDRQMLASALSAVGSSLLRSHDPASRKALQDALDIHLASGQVRKAARTLADLALWESYFGDYETALELNNRAIGYARDEGDENALFGFVMRRGVLLKDVGRHSEGEPFLFESIEIGRRLGMASSWAYARLVELHIEAGDLSGARTLLPQAVRVALFEREEFEQLELQAFVRYVDIVEDGPLEAIAGTSSDCILACDRATSLTLIYWNLASLCLELAALGLGRIGEPCEAAWLFGATQSIRRNANVQVSPSLKTRWARISQRFGLADFSGAIAAGQNSSVPEALGKVAEAEKTILNRATS
ncbi:MAG TPA: NB-ARC domain-containing protein, partial [Fimbriimonas sp.]|nr:NB-ARC domain-containing protein [Fimbriimonas sp.]